MHDGLPEDVWVPDDAPESAGQDLLPSDGGDGAEGAHGGRVGVLGELAPLAVGGAEHGVADQVHQDERGQLKVGEGRAGMGEEG